MHTLENIQDYVKALFEQPSFSREPHRLYDPITYTLSMGGKRLRPTLLLAAADLFGGDLEQAGHAAMGIETFHNFTLLHDDLMDQSPVRRGKPTVYRKWDENTAILSGDAMTALAWRHMLHEPHPKRGEILEAFNETCLMIYEGQQYDMDFEQRDDVSIDEYMKMIRLKTAVLLAGALQIGALYASAPADDIEQLYQFGIGIGLAFQLRDDLLDVYGDVAVFGKQNGTDIQDNKKTYLMLRALEKGDDRQRQRLQALFATKPADPAAKVREVIQIYNDLGIRQEVEAQIARLHAEAAAHLDAVHKDDADKATLRQIASSLLDRNH